MIRARTSFPACLALSMALMASWARASSPDESEAAKRTIAVPEITVKGEMRDVAMQRIEGAFLEGLAQSEVAVLSPEEVREIADQEGACEDAACLTRVIQSTGASHALQLTIQVEGRDYELVVLLVKADGSTSESRTECNICGFDEAAELAAQQAVLLSNKVLKDAAPAYIDVVSDPPGALVTVDGEAFGTTPLREQIPEGKHVVRIELSGHGARSREFVAAAGETASVEVKLEPLPEWKEDGGATDRRRKVLLGVGGALLGLGLGAAGAGGALIAIDHDPPESRCDDPDAIGMGGVCRWRYETQLGGIIAVSVGGAAAIVGAVLVGVAASKNKKGKRAGKRARVVPTFSGVRVSF